MMIPREKYDLIVRILWWLKVPEVLATIATIIGFILFGFGLVPIFVPLFAFCTRLVLFPVRILIVRIKRKIEKSSPVALKMRGTSFEMEIKRIVSRLELLQMENTGRVHRWINYVFGKK